MRFLKHLAAFFKDFLLFAWQHKLWWLVPIVLVLLALALFITAGASVAPFIYTLF